MTVMLNGRRILAMSFLATLAACGGGGGSSAPGSTATPTPPVVAGGGWLTVTGHTTKLVTYEGESAMLTVTTTPRSGEKMPYIGVTGNGIVENFWLKPSIDGAIGIGVETGKALTAGTHNGTVAVRVCEDDASVCSKPLPGSPWYLPLQVEVRSKAEGAKRVSWAPAAIEVSAFEGEAATVTVVGKTNGDSRLNFAELAVGASPLLSAEKAVIKGQNTFTVSLQSAANLAQGEHNTTIALSLCYDGAACKSPASGSPWTIPLKVTVKSSANLTPLSVVPLAGPWNGRGANAAHDGHVAAAFDPSKFNRRWLNLPPADIIRNGPFAADAGVALLTKYNSTTKSNYLEAVSEVSGQRLWMLDFGTLRLGMPAVADGKVRILSDSTEMRLWTLDLSDGSLLNVTTVSALFSFGSTTPVLFGGAAYVNTGSTPGMRKLAGAAYDQGFSLPLYPSVNFWEPTVDSGRVYTASQGNLQGFSALDGSADFQIAGGLNVQMAYTPMLSGPVAPSGKQMAYVRDFPSGSVVAFDLDLKTRAYATAPGAADAAVANGVLYTVGGNTLEARNALTGASLWKWQSTLPAHEGPFDRVILTDNLAFVRTERSTVAIDLVSHALVWSYPLAGHMSISNRGVLHIAGGDGTWVAINLQ